MHYPQKNHLSQQNELPNLDLLRATAVLLVLADHVLETIGHKANLSFHPYDWYLGRLGVLIFFVHTSLVLMWSMQRLRLQGGALLKSFYIRRAFRIYPLSMLSVVAVLLFGIPTLPWETFSAPAPLAIASNLLLTMNLTTSPPVLAPMWSLPLEMQMYLTLPLIFIFTNSPKSIRNILGIYVVTLFAALLLPAISSRFSVAQFAPCFMAGVLAYGLQQQTNEKYPGFLWPLFLVSIISLYVAIEELTPGIHHNLLQWLICLVLGTAIPFVKQLSVRPINLVAHFLAKYSYGIYLFHCIALWISCYELDLPAPLQWTAMATILIALSVLSFHLIEQPAIRFGAKLAKQQPAFISPNRLKRDPEQQENKSKSVKQLHPRVGGRVR